MAVFLDWQGFTYPYVNLVEKFQGLPLLLKSPGIFSANWHYICVKLNY